MAASLRDRFVAGEARISYRELSARGGRVIAWFRHNCWFYRHETETDADARKVYMNAGKARVTFPNDAMEVC